SRRDFTRLFAFGGSAALFAHPAWAQTAGARPSLPASGPTTGEAFWKAVRAQFVMPPDLAVMNAANLCPSSAPVLEALTRETRSVDQDPSQQNRARLGPAKESTRKALAEFLRVTPEEVVITRNTSEANNLVSTGLDLKAGDEVLIFSDNHPCNNTAWQEKAKRFGYTVTVVPQKNPHPGADYYLDAFSKALTPRTKVLSFTHLTSTVGDLFPAKELCKLARDRGIISMIDGAQTFGLLDVDLSDIQPDFYSGSAHKWPCGARECGVLYVSARVHDRLWGSIYSAYPGAVGISRKVEGLGQRDESSIIAFGEALAFQNKVGRKAIEQRSRQLAQQLMAGLSKIDGVTLWTSPVPERSAAVVSFQPAALDARKVAQTLYDKDKIGITTRGGDDRPGLRVSPHFFNTPEEVDRLLAALSGYMRSGTV
ncbi:MAG TPA: aminotransferase class V-fold PLP-dependent enzyme, partial [Vicinamibacterales bacterium]|nr:aminotransferase class V-fold PLP-dependent enzyme [Vicinamibacterales bacterium]